MKSRRKKGEERPGALRWFKVMYPETYRRTRRPLWFEGTHLQVFRYPEQGIIPVIYQGKKKTTFLDPRAIVFTALTEKLSQVDYSPRYFALDDHAPWAREWLLEHPHWGVEGCELDWERAITPMRKGQPEIE